MELFQTNYSRHANLEIFRLATELNIRISQVLLKWFGKNLDVAALMECSKFEVSTTGALIQQ